MAEERLSKELRVRQWGGVARNRMRTLGIHRQYKIRVCKECGEMLRTYEGSNDSIGSYVRYIQDNQIFALAHNFDFAYSAYLRYKDDLMREPSLYRISHPPYRSQCQRWRSFRRTTI